MPKSEAGKNKTKKTDRPLVVICSTCHKSLLLSAMKFVHLKENLFPNVVSVILGSCCTDVSSHIKFSDQFGLN